LKVDKNLLLSIDYGTINYLRQKGNTKIKTPYIIDFETMLKDTDFPRFMREIKIKGIRSIFYSAGLCRPGVWENR